MKRQALKISELFRGVEYTTKFSQDWKNIIFVA